MIIVIVGATASGKSDLAVALAKRYHAEIISGDSIQVYKELTIGSAKISQEEMQGIQHYFINTHHFDEPYSVKVFQQQGRKYIADILKRGKNVIICGGTGLYIKALLYDYIFEEETQDEAYFTFLQEKTTEDLYQMLIEVDFEATNTIHPNNRKRIIRALMIANTGEKKSDRIKKQEHQMLYDALLIGLHGDRTFLYERINKRVDQMIEDGLEEEVRALLREDVFKLQSMQAIGYKEWKEYFEGKIDKATVIENIKKNTRQLAKRQHTFFNNQMPIRYFSIQEDYEKQIIQYIEENNNE